MEADIMTSERGLDDIFKIVKDAIQKAVKEEREACAAIADAMDDGETSNKPEYSAVEHATKFTIKAVAENIARRIRGPSSSRTESPIGPERLYGKPRWNGFRAVDQSDRGFQLRSEGLGWTKRPLSVAVEKHMFSVYSVQLSVKVLVFPE